MGMFFRFLVFQELGFSADTQSARLEAHLDLLPVESRKLGACGKPFSRFREVELHGGEEFGFREEPILPVVSVNVPAVLENIIGAPGNEIEYVLCMFEKFMNAYEIHVSADFYG
jgi:hypothetical protein